MAKQKYYAVWKGRSTGVFSSWEACKEQVDGYEGAQYKSFSSEQEARQALEYNYWISIKKKQQPAPLGELNNRLIKPDLQSISVDAACSGNPGIMEYRGVWTATGEEIFRVGPYQKGTNNIGEFLAIVHGLAFLKQKNLDVKLYSDSATALAWLKQKKCKTKLEQTLENRYIFELIARAEQWLQMHSYSNQVLKWNTEQWGEIPADFGRK